MAALSTAAHAEETKTPPQTAWEASRRQGTDNGKISTGVARARDPLDSATSASSMEESDIARMSSTSFGDLLRNVPGIRAEAAGGESNGNYTIRGLPLVSSGAKFLQFQEDGMPILEFGDIFTVTPDTLIRADFNVARIESIRGGSASTFASDAPGGVINLISKTGEVEGGSVQFSAGVNHDYWRSDFDYGGRLGPTLRFHIGGFYRAGDGRRNLGYTGDRGGQVKFNITKEFTGGYFRLYGKYLDDRAANYPNQPMLVSGTDENPVYKDIPGFSARRDSVQSPFISAIPGIDGNNNLTIYNPRDGYHVVAKSIGFDAKFDIGEWSVTDRMRYSNQSVDLTFINPLAASPAAFGTTAFGAPGGQYAYASGPLKGQIITNPAGLNGNGLIGLSLLVAFQLPDLNNFTNDLRISRVWEAGGGELTATAGLYNARQRLHQNRALVNFLQDFNGDSSSSLIDIVKANGTRLTQDGVLTYFGPGFGQQQSYDVTYAVTAPYGSVNFRTGKLAIGASVRVDTGKADGTSRANTPANLQTIDVNGDGVISDAERTFPFAPYSNTSPINYDYNFVSYSGSLNYRIAENLSAFARYSRGARAGADRLILTPEINANDGSLVSKTASYDPVKQTEVGFKFRGEGLFLNLTGFWAKVRETNTQLLPSPLTGLLDLALVKRSIRAYGAELEGGVRRGAFSLTANATVTDAKIIAAEDLALVGNTPRRQAKLIFQVMPQYDTELFTIGANLIGTTSSYAQDQNQLKMHGYTTVNAFVQVRPISHVVVSLNVNNLFDILALNSVASSSIPAGGVVMVQPLFGRTITSAVRLYF